MNSHSYFTGLQMYSLLLILILITSCNRQNKTDLPKGNSNVPEQPVINTPVSDPTFVVSRDTISTYGPRSITRSVLQDKKGNFWFAAWEGILHYDGKLFTNVTLKEGLRHFHVFSLLEDRSGNLWFGTIGGGVYKYDARLPASNERDVKVEAGQGKLFTLFTIADSLAGNKIFCMLEDKEGNIWFGTDNGVSRYNGKGFTNFTTQDGLSNNFVSSIIQDKTGKLWFGTNSGVSCYDNKLFTNFKNKEGTSFQNVRSIIEDKNGKIWIASQEGLSRYDPGLNDIAGSVKALTTISTNFIGNIFEDKQGNLWLSEGQANSSGMTLTKYDGITFTKIKDDKQVFGIIEDNAGNIWFGTADGVCRYDIRQAGFTKFSEQ